MPTILFQASITRLPLGDPPQRGKLVQEPCRAEDDQPDGLLGARRSDDAADAQQVHQVSCAKRSGIIPVHPDRFRRLQFVSFANIYSLTDQTMRSISKFTRDLRALDIRYVIKHLQIGCEFEN